MPRQLRSALPDGVFHVTARAVSDCPLFADDEDRRGFVWILGQLTARFEIRCLAYCLMGTHNNLRNGSRRGILRLVERSGRSRARGAMARTRIEERTRAAEREER